MTAPRCLDIASACKALSVSRSTLYKMHKKNQLRIVKLLSKSVVPVEDIDRLIPAYPTPVGGTVGEPPKPKIKKVVLVPHVS